VKAALKTVDFWVLCLANTLFMLGPHFMVSTFKDFGAANNFGEAFLLNQVTINTVSNGVARFVCGAIADKVSNKGIFVVCLAAEFLIYLSSQFLFKKEFTFSILCAMLFFLFGMNMSIIPAISGKVFGVSVGSVIYTYIMPFSALANFTQYKIYNIFKDDPTKMFYIFAVCSVVAFTLMLLFFREKLRWN
jgi:MFS family permease